MIEQQLKLPLGVGGLQLLTPGFGQLVAEAGVLLFDVAVVEDAGEEVADRAEHGVGAVLDGRERVLDPAAHRSRPAFATPIGYRG